MNFIPMQQIYVSNHFYSMGKISLFIGFATEFVLETIVHDQRQKKKCMWLLFYDANFLMGAFFLNSSWKFPSTVEVFFLISPFLFSGFVNKFAECNFCYFFIQTRTMHRNEKAHEKTFKCGKHFCDTQKTTIFVHSEDVLFVV